MRSLICYQSIDIITVLVAVLIAVATCQIPDGVTVEPNEVGTTPISNVGKPQHHHNTMDAMHQREKKQLSPIYFDGTPPVQQPGLISNIPIIGTLIPGIQGQNGLLAGITGPLGTGLNGLLGGLGGGLGGGGLTNIGGILMPQQPSPPMGTCPISQKLTCRCESLSPKTPSPVVIRNNGDVTIIRQANKTNADKTREIIAELSNGLMIYQKINTDNGNDITEGYYSLRLSDEEEKYLTIHFNASELDYSVKADVTNQPPKTITL